MSATLAARAVVENLPRTVDVVTYAGDDLSLTITVTDDGQPADLTGAQVRAQIRTRPGSPGLLASFAVGIDGNVITIGLPGMITAQLPWLAVYDCELDRDGVRTLVAGTIRTWPQVTQ